jgi:hypothetical protein
VINDYDKYIFDENFTGDQTRCIVQYHNGDIYIGEILKGKKDYIGKMIYSDGREY